MRTTILALALAACAAAPVLAQQTPAPAADAPPAAAAPPAFSAPAEAGFQRAHAGLCNNPRLLGCLDLAQSACNAALEPWMAECRAKAGPSVANSQNEDMTFGFFMGCGMGRALNANPQRASGFLACMTGRGGQ